ncbi:unnamed protein product [Aphanomyces euteiches]
MSLAAVVFRRVKFYVFINGFICAIAATVHYLEALFRTQPLVGVYIGTLVRIASVIGWFEWIATFKGKIYGDKRILLTASQQFSIMIQIALVVVPIEMVSVYTGRTIAVDRTIAYPSLLHEFVYFIPKSLVLELVFDLLHYTVHYTCHRVPFLYKHVHKQHHLHIHPSALSTYEEGFLDLVLTNVVPMAVAFAVSPALSTNQLQLALAYKSYVEVAGHCGLDLKGMSFPQMPLVQYLSICLRIHDHDLHHTQPNVNFAKRFSLWDQLFGTFKASIM